MRPLRPACGTVSNAQLLTLPPIIRIIAPGEVTTQLSSLPPASSIARDVLGSSERRLATAQPPEPPPTTTKSNVSTMPHPPDRCYHALPVLVVARDEAKQSCCHRIEPLGLFGGRSRVFPLKSLVPGWAFAAFMARARWRARFGARNARFALS